MIVWIASGLYMWWGLPSHRRFGWLTILSLELPRFSCSRSVSDQCDRLA